MAFDMTDYVDVKHRLQLALLKYPTLRIVEDAPELIHLGERIYIQCAVTVFRDETDALPMRAFCWEVWPGRTPFTKMSENEVGFTSALGRALGYMGFGINKSIASRNEVEAAQSRQTSTHLAPVVPLHDVEVPFPDTPQRDWPSPKQLGMMRALANGQGLKGDDLKTFISATLGREVQTTGDLDKRDVSKVIDALKLSEPKN